mgnify:CR=1 FL=1
MVMQWDSAVTNYKSNQQARIIDTLAELILEDGLVGLNMAKLARSSGLSRQTLYNYFPDIESVLINYVNTKSMYLDTQIRELLSIIDDPSEKLDAFVGGLVMTLPDQAPFSVLEMSVGQQRDCDTRFPVKLISSLLSEVLQEGVQDGIFRKEVLQENFSISLVRMLFSFQPIVVKARVDTMVFASMAVDLVRRTVIA